MGEKTADWVWMKQDADGMTAGALGFCAVGSIQDVYPNQRLAISE